MRMFRGDDDGQRRAGVRVIGGRRVDGCDVERVARGRMDRRSGGGSIRGSDNVAHTTTTEDDDGSFISRISFVESSISQDDRPIRRRCARHRRKPAQDRRVTERWRSPQWEKMVHIPPRPRVRHDVRVRQPSPRRDHHPAPDGTRDEIGRGDIRSRPRIGREREVERGNVDLGLHNRIVRRRLRVGQTCHSNDAGGLSILCPVRVGVLSGPRIVLRRRRIPAV